MKRFNQQHGHVFYCKQLPCGEILTVIYCYNKQIIEIMASRGGEINCPCCPSRRFVALDK